MHAGGTFETEMHHEEDDESVSEETEEEEEENMSEGESSETSEDRYIEQSFEVMFICDKDASDMKGKVVSDLILM